MFQKIKNYLVESRHELRSVQWPTRADATKLTFIVIGVSIGLAFFLGVFDAVFSYLLKIFIVRS